jgi:hypothetical protein
MPQLDATLRAQQGAPVLGFIDRFDDAAVVIAAEPDHPRA